MRTFDSDGWLGVIVIILHRHGGVVVESTDTVVVGLVSI